MRWPFLLLLLQLTLTYDLNEHLNFGLSLPILYSKITLHTSTLPYLVAQLFAEIKLKHRERVQLKSKLHWHINRYKYCSPNVLLLNLQTRLLGCINSLHCKATMLKDIVGAATPPLKFDCTRLDTCWQQQSEFPNEIAVSHPNIWCG